MKQFTKETFMSWENEGPVWNPETKKYDSDKVRAIALCDLTSGWFEAAINCMRDGDMGEKDENGVYERIWWSDGIDCNGKERETLRPATHQEVELYLKYCPIVATDQNPYVFVYARIEDENGIHIIFKRRGWFGKNIRFVWYAVSNIPKRIRFKFRCLRYNWNQWRNRNKPVKPDKPDKPNPNAEWVRKIVEDACKV